jgi:hypothetical protein
MTTLRQRVYHAWMFLHWQEEMRKNANKNSLQSCKLPLMRCMVTSLCACAKSCKISKTRGDKIPQQNRIQAPPNWQWEMRTNQTFLKPYQKLTRKLQIAIDEMTANFIVCLCKSCNSQNQE